MYLVFITLHFIKINPLQKYKKNNTDWNENSNPYKLVCDFVLDVSESDCLEICNSGESDWDAGFRLRLSDEQLRVFEAGDFDLVAGFKVAVFHSGVQHFAIDVDFAGRT